MSPRLKKRGTETKRFSCEGPEIVTPLFTALESDLEADVGVGTSCEAATSAAFIAIEPKRWLGLIGASAALTLGSCVRAILPNQPDTNARHRQTEIQNRMLALQPPFPRHHANGFTQITGPGGDRRRPSRTSCIWTRTVLTASVFAASEGHSAVSCTIIIRRLRPMRAATIAAEATISRYQPHASEGGMGMATWTRQSAVTAWAKCSTVARCGRPNLTA
jgi:hypothetical protein